MPALLPGQVKQLAYSVMNEKQIGEFEAKQEMNLSISAENLGRFRVNVFVQRGETGMVVRYIKNKSRHWPHWACHRCWKSWCCASAAWCW